MRLHKPIHVLAARGGAKLMKLSRRSRGQAVILLALGAIVLFAFLAFVIDFGRIWWTRQRLRNYCDAAALAGAQNLPDATAAKNSATNYYARNLVETDCKQDPVNVQWQSDAGDKSHYWIDINDFDDVSVETPYTNAKLTERGIPPESAIRVGACRKLNHHIGALFGQPTVRVCAYAIAIQGCPDTIDGQDDQVIPIGYPTVKPLPNDDWDDQTDQPWIDPNTWTVGQEYPLNLEGNGVYGNHYYIALGGTGWNVYRDNWKFGAQGTFKIGNIVETEPGIKNGPTDQGINYRVDQCPDATWDNMPDDCPRVITTLLVDPTIDDYHGRSDVKIVGYARWFILPYDKTGGPGDPNKTVKAIFLEQEVGGGGFSTGNCTNIIQVALVE